MRATRIAFTVPEGEPLPEIGSPVSIPVNDGHSWFELGVIESGHLGEDGTVTLTFRLDERLEEVGPA